MDKRAGGAGERCAGTATSRWCTSMGMQCISASRSRQEAATQVLASFLKHGCCWCCCQHAGHTPGNMPWQHDSMPGGAGRRVAASSAVRARVRHARTQVACCHGFMRKKVHVARGCSMQDVSAACLRRGLLAHACQDVTAVHACVHAGVVVCAVWRQRFHEPLLVPVFCAQSQACYKQPSVGSSRQAAGRLLCSFLSCPTVSQLCPDTPSSEQHSAQATRNCCCNPALHPALLHTESSS